MPPVITPYEPITIPVGNEYLTVPESIAQALGSQPPVNPLEGSPVRVIPVTELPRIENYAQIFAPFVDVTLGGQDGLKFMSLTEYLLSANYVDSITTGSSIITVEVSNPLGTFQDLPQFRIGNCLTLTFGYRKVFPDAPEPPPPLIVYGLIGRLKADFADHGMTIQLTAYDMGSILTNLCEAGSLKVSGMTPVEAAQYVVHQVAPYMRFHTTKTAEPGSAEIPEVGATITVSNGSNRVYWGAPIDGDLVVPTSTSYLDILFRLADMMPFDPVTGEGGWYVHRRGVDLYFMPLAVMAAPILQIVYADSQRGTLMSLTVRYEPQHDETSGQDISADDQTGEMAGESHDDTEPAATGDYPTHEAQEPEMSADADPDAAVTGASVQEASTSQEGRSHDAQSMANWLAEQKLSTLQATLQCIGDTRIHANSVLLLVNLGRMFSGPWNVLEVTHSIDRQGYRCKCELQRNATAQDFCASGRGMAKVVSPYRDPDDVKPTPPGGSPAPGLPVGLPPVGAPVTGTPAAPEGD